MEGLVSRHEYPANIEDDAAARAVGFGGEMLLLICTRAHPPGRPLAISVQLPESVLALQGKSQGSKLRADNRFDVRVKLSSVRREQRAALEAAFASAPG